MPHVPLLVTHFHVLLLCGVLLCVLLCMPHPFMYSVCIPTNLVVHVHVIANCVSPFLSLWQLNNIIVFMFYCM